MKKKGSTTEFATDRQVELLQAYRREASTARVINIDKIMERVIAQPASRYWVSEERALAVVRALRRGEDPLSGMRPTKQRMFCDIMSRVNHLSTQRPDLSLPELVTWVVNSQAPEHYMTLTYARILIYKAIRNGRRG